MGEVRRLAEAADMQPPAKSHRIERKHPLYDLAVSWPGEFFWRADQDLNHFHGFDDKPWNCGADSARAFRQADVDRYNSIREEARERRKQRR